MLVQHRDVIFSTVGVYPRATAYIGPEASNWVVSTGFAVLRCNSKLYPRFLYHVIQSTPFMNCAIAASTGVIFKATNAADFANIKIPVPSIETQKTIADFLDHETTYIDQLMESKVALCKLLEERLKSKIASKFVFSRNAPRQPLHRFCKILTGKTPKRADKSNFSTNHGLPWAKPADLGSFVPINRTEEMLTEKGCKGQVIVNANTVLVNGIGAGIGKVGFAKYKMSYNQQIHGIMQFKKLLDDRFLFFFMFTKKGEIISLANDTTIPIINSERLGRILVPLLSIDIQKNIVTDLEIAIEDTCRLFNLLDTSILKFGELRLAIILATVTGQIDASKWRKERQIDRHLEQLEEETSE